MLDDGMMVVKVPEYGKSFDVALKDTVIPGLSIGKTAKSAFCPSAFNAFTSG